MTLFLGFSFGSYSQRGYQNTPSIQEEMTQDLYSTIAQWFHLFPEYKSNPFYVFGESYGAKFAILIANKIHRENGLLKQSPMVITVLCNIQ